MSNQTTLLEGATVNLAELSIDGLAVRAIKDLDGFKFTDDSKIDNAAAAAKILDPVLATLPETITVLTQATALTHGFALASLRLRPYVVLAGNKRAWHGNSDAWKVTWTNRVEQAWTGPDELLGTFLTNVRGRIRDAGLRHAVISEWLVGSVNGLGAIECVGPNGNKMTVKQLVAMACNKDPKIVRKVYGVEIPKKLHAELVKVYAKQTTKSGDPAVGFEHVPTMFGPFTPTRKPKVSTEDNANPNTDSSPDGTTPEGTDESSEQATDETTDPAVSVGPESPEKVAEFFAAIIRGENYNPVWTAKTLHHLATIQDERIAAVSVAKVQRKAEFAKVLRETAGMLLHTADRVEQKATGVKVTK